MMMFKILGSMVEGKKDSDINSMELDVHGEVEEGAEAIEKLFLPPSKVANKLKRAGSNTSRSEEVETKPCSKRRTSTDPAKIVATRKASAANKPASDEYGVPDLTTLTNMKMKVKTLVSNL